MTSKRLWLFAAVLAAAVCASRAARAEFVVVDATYTHSVETTKDSHFRVQPPAGTPGNWTSPIDYASGEAWVRLEVMTKPAGDTPTKYQVCFELAVNYACTDQAPTYTKPGVYTWGTQFSKFYLGGPVDWSKGIRDVALILKDTNNVKPAPENVGDTVSARYMPTDLHVTVTLVPKGETYVPPAGGDAGSKVDAAPDSAEPLTDDAASSAETSAPPIDHPPTSDAGLGTPGPTPMDPPMPTTHDAGSSTTLNGQVPSGDMESGCTCSQVPSHSSGTRGWVLALPLLAMLRRRRAYHAPLD